MTLNMETVRAVACTPLFGLTLTIGSYLLSIWVFRKFGEFPLLNPVLTAAIPVVAVIYYLPIDYSNYANSTELLSLLLGTTTVSLSIPLYRHLPTIHSEIPAIISALLAGSTVAPASAIVIAWLTGGNNETLLSVAPKSITTPIAMAVSECIGGLASITAGTVISVSVFGAIVTAPLLRMLRIDNQAVLGFTLGLSAHGLGTAKAFEYSPIAGAFACLGLALTGALTSIAMPLIYHTLL
ncbi:MAG: LrgB family protein [Endozoicomonadaceae bacterium]|nr:LrgB family protein [Endozoicomonadaceae bacterium]